MQASQTASQAVDATANSTTNTSVDTVATLQDQLVGMGEGFVRALPGIAIALVVLLVTWIVARFAARIADLLIGKTDVRPSLKNLIDTLVRLVIWIIGIMIAAIVVMPGLTPASLFAGLGIGAVAIGFAFQDIFENFMAGVLIMLREKMRIGDIIECDGIVGKVEHITLRETHVRKLSGEVTLDEMEEIVDVLNYDDAKKAEAEQAEKAAEQADPPSPTAARREKDARTVASAVVKCLEDERFVEGLFSSELQLPAQHEPISMDVFAELQPAGGRVTSGPCHS